MLRQYTGRQDDTLFRYTMKMRLNLTFYPEASFRGAYRKNRIEQNKEYNKQLMVAFVYER